MSEPIAEVEPITPAPEEPISIGSTPIIGEEGRYTVLWIEEGTTELQGFMLIGDIMAHANLARKTSGLDDFSILQIWIPPLSAIGIEPLTILPLPLSLQPLVGSVITQNGQGVGMFEISTVPGPVLDYSPIDESFTYFSMEVLAARLDTENADLIFVEAGGLTWQEASQ